MPFTYDPTTICQKLRCKEMLLHDGDPNARADDAGLFDDYDAVAYWCECTQTGRGPDGDRVHMSCCSRGTSRGCFVSLESLV